MSVENMAGVSLFLLAAAGILATAAAVMFFWFDIPRCLRMVSGRFFVRGLKKAESEKQQQKRPQTEALSRSGETMLLDADTAGKTTLLSGDLADGTSPLDGNTEGGAPWPGIDNLELVQDIAYNDEGAIS